MSVVLQAVLGEDDLVRVRAELGEVAWAAGKRTAGPTARAVKENLQAPGEDPRTQALERFVREGLERHPLFEVAARPRRFSRLMFSRYEPGMSYGAHTDDALMGAGEGRVRSDLAFTLFLSDRQSYEGGALVVENGLGEQEVRLEAGDAILYPAGSVHRVSPVTRGVRLAAVGWVESMIADPAQRDLLFDLSLTRTRLAEAGAAREQLLGLDKAISNLLRMWARV